MTTISPHTTRAPGTILTATIYNFDHGNHIANAQALNSGKIEGAGSVVDGVIPVFDGVSGAALRSSGKSFPLGTADLANDSVTYAKLQNASATARILARKTSGAGDYEECTLSEVLDFIGLAAQGDILYRGSSAWARLGIGSTGDVLTVASGLPAWGTGPSIVKISATSANNSASVDFTGLSSTYIAYIVQIANLIPATDGADLYMRTDENNGASFETANYRYATTSALDDSDSYSIFRSTSAGQMVLVLAAGNATDENISGLVYIHNPSSALAFLASWDMVQLNNAALFRRRTGGGTQPVTTAVNAIRFLMSAGNITSGTFTLYGVLP